MIHCCHAAGATLMLAGAFESEAVQKRAEAMPEYTCVQYFGILGRQGIAELYAKCRAGLVMLADTPSYRESEPIKLFEYLCAGLPVIASDFLHWREIALISGATFVPADRDDEAITAIRQAITHPVEVDIKVARQKFSFKSDEDRLLQFFDALEQKGRRQPSTF